MGKDFKWGFTEWNKVPVYYSNTNKKYYWEKCKPHISSKHSIELLGDVQQIKEYFTLIQQMLDNISTFSTGNRLESEMEIIIIIIIIAESKSFSNDLQILHAEFSDITEKQEAFKLIEIENKVHTLKKSIEQSNFYYEYLYFKEMFHIRHCHNSESSFISAVEVKANKIAEEKRLKYKEELEKLLDAAKQDYKNKIEVIAQEANIKYIQIESELKNMKVQLDISKNDIEYYKNYIQKLKKENELEVNKLTLENKSLKSEWESTKLKLLKSSTEVILL